MRKDTAKRNRHYHCLEYDYEQSGDLYLIACGMERCDPGVRYGPDLREGFHLHAVLSGTGTLWAGGKTFTPRFGQLFLLKDGEVAEYAADTLDPWEYCWVTYHGTDAARLSEEIGFREGVYCLDSRVEAKAFYELVLRMHEKPEMNYGNDLRRRGILLEFLALALEATENRESARRPACPAQTCVDRAIAFIHYNYATIQVRDIVEYIGYTRSYFTTLFKNRTGLSPQEYLTQYRLQRACQLLTQTTQPIQRIAAQVGYEDQMAFSRMFKNAYGISPTEYRNRGRDFGTN